MKHFQFSMAAFSLAAAVSIQAAISITSDEFSYSQNFDSLPTGSTGSSLDWTNNSTIHGWYQGYQGSTSSQTEWSFQVVPTGSGTVASGGINTNTSARFVNIGYANSTDRSVGLYRPFSTTGSVGVVFQNNSGMTLPGFAIGYTGEQWRRGGTEETSLYFEYQVVASVDGLDINSGPENWTRVDALRFDSPRFDGGALNLDGKHSAHRRIFPPHGIMTAIPEGKFLVVRWYQDRRNKDGDLVTVYHMLAVDDVSMSPVPEPSEAGELRIISFSRNEKDDLVLTFRSPFANREHVIEHRSDLIAGEWRERPGVTTTALGDDLYEARFPFDEGVREFYRLAVQPEEMIVSVRDFGAVPDDENCDAAAINAAIQHARATGASVVEFEAGVYHLKYQDDREAPTLMINNVSDLVLRGQSDSTGAPATVLELNLPLRNNFGVRHLDARNSRNLTLENLVFDLNPRFSASGKVVEVIPENQEVRVEILPGMPHFEGMRCYSANAWDLESRELLPVPPLTINMLEPYFENLWHRVEDDERIVYSIRNMPFVGLVEPGDGVSWHFAVQTPTGFTLAFNTIDGLDLRNLRIYNSITLSMKAYDVSDVTITDVRIEPEGNSLAVGPRDAIHLSNPRGELLVDNLYVKGVRWDPFVSRVNFVTVVEVNGNSLECVYSTVGNAETFFQVGDKVDFWTGEEPFKMEVVALEVLSPRGEKRFLLEFDKEIPSSVEIGTLISPPTWDQAVIRNSTFEGNVGTAIVWENANLTLEDCRFHNNTYNAIGIGPTSLRTGAFGENILIRNNHFSASNWVSKYGRNHGMITTFEQHPAFTNEPYNRNITIIGNVFEDIEYNPAVAAIQIRNAQNVHISDNTFRNVSNTVVVDPGSTKDIYIDDGTED